MIDTTACETITGQALLVKISDQTISFENEAGDRIRTYALAEFATVRGALALMVGQPITLHAETVAALQQYAWL